MLDSLFDLAGRVVDGREGLRNRAFDASQARRKQEWENFSQQEEAARQRQALAMRQQRQEELAQYPAQANAIAAVNNTAANNELQRTLAQQTATTGLAQGVMTHAANIKGGLDTTQTNNDLRLFEPVKELAQGQRVADREMANLFIGNDPGNPLSQQVIGSAERMQGNQYDLIRELAQMNQPSAFSRFIGDVTPLLAVASAFIK
jgi:mannose/fructose/N-acetylgalactosamine-specific phosphotransferase system component IIB